MSADESKKARDLKERAAEELRIFAVIALYLWLFLGSFAAYRRLVLAEAGVTYLHYGVALVEALVIAKVVLIGRIFGFSRRFEDRPLIVPTLYKSVVFALLVIAFAVLEHLLVGWIHHRSALASLREFAEVGVYELSARVLMLTVAFVPFFAFYEVGRSMGMGKLAALFFRRHPAAAG